MSASPATSVNAIVTRSWRLGVLAATLLLAGALLAWSVVTPGYRGPDEPQHASVAVDLALDGVYPAPGTETVDVGITGGYAWFGFPGASDYYAITVEVGEVPVDAPTLRELRDAGVTDLDADLRNQITQHPPLYSAYLAAGIHVLGLADAPVTTSLLVMRLLSAILLLPVPALIASTARRAGLSASASLLGALVPAAWVQFVHIGAVINNGTLLALLASAAIALMVRVATGDLRRRTAIALGLALMGALLTKGYALALLPLAVFAYLWRWREDRTRIWSPMAIGAAIAAIGLSWYIHSLIVYGTVQPTSESKTIVYDADKLGPWIPEFLHGLSSSMWLNLGWIETPLRPPILHYAMSVGAIVLIALGSWRLRRAPAVLVILHGSWVLTALIFMYGSIRHWMWDETIRAAQGRYLHLAVVSFAVLIAAAATWPRWVSVVAPAAVAVVAVGGLIAGLRHFWEGASPATSAAAWPGGSVALAGAGALLLGGAVLGTSVAVRTQRLTASATSGEVTPRRTATPDRPGRAGPSSRSSRR